MIVHQCSSKAYSNPYTYLVTPHMACRVSNGELLSNQIVASYSIFYTVIQVSICVANISILRLPPSSSFSSVGDMIFRFVGVYQEDVALAHDQGSHLVIITPLAIMKGILTTRVVNNYVRCFTQILYSAMNTEIMLHIRSKICTSRHLPVAHHHNYANLMVNRKST